MKEYTPKEYSLERRIPLVTLYKLLKQGKVPGQEKIGRLYRIWWEKPKAEKR